MDKEVVENLEKNNILKRKVLEIEDLVLKKHLKEAYDKVLKMIDYINVKYIKAKYNIDLKDKTMIDATEVYLKRDKFLFRDMQAVNCDYNDVNFADMETIDVEYLISYADVMYEHMVKNIGEFIK